MAQACLSLFSPLSHPLIDLELAADMFFECAESREGRELNFDFRAPPLENNAPAHPPLQPMLAADSKICCLPEER